MVGRGRVEDSDKKPDVERYKELIATYAELGTERVGQALPVSKVREYLREFCLPDYWYPIIIQVDKNHRELEASDG